jgi:hypothetical protein
LNPYKAPRAAQAHDLDVACILLDEQQSTTNQKCMSNVDTKGMSSVYHWLDNDPMGQGFLALILIVGFALFFAGLAWL